MEDLEKVCICTGRNSCLNWRSPFISCVSQRLLCICLNQNPILELSPHSILSFLLFVTCQIIRFSCEKQRIIDPYAIFAKGRISHLPLHNYVSNLSLIRLIRQTSCLIASGLIRHTSCLVAVMASGQTVRVEAFNSK